MAQAQRTINQVIIQALYLCGELAVGETPDAFMKTQGLYAVNDLLNQFTADSVYIPFQTDVTFTLTVGQSDYTLSDIVPADVDVNRVVDLTFANYSVQSIVYPLKIINKATYRGVVRLNNLIARPGFVILNKQAEESIITFYPAPDQPYPVNLGLKLMINEIEQQDLLTTSVPPYYERFLKYAIAREFTSIYPSANWNERAEEEYQRMFYDIKACNETDLTLRPTVILNSPQPFYWPNIIAY